MQGVGTAKLERRRAQRPITEPIRVRKHTIAFVVDNCLPSEWPKNSPQRTSFQMKPIYITIMRALIAEYRSGKITTFGIYVIV